MKREPAVMASEQYLRRATRGLWGRRRHEVREELAAHLHERVLAHRIGGLGEAEALERALVELGEPGQVQVGMLQLYTLPTVAGSGLALAAACALVVALLPSGAAQAPVSGTFYWPSAACTTALRNNEILEAFQTCEVLDNSLWLDTPVLTRTLAAQGVTVESGDAHLALTFPGAGPVRVPTGSGPTPTFPVASDTAPAVPDALNLWNLVQAVSNQSALPIRFLGWDDPTVAIGEASFKLGTKIRPVSGDDFYGNYLSQVFFRDLLDPLLASRLINVSVLNPRSAIGMPGQETELTVEAGASGVYGVMILHEPETLVGFLPADAERFDLYISLEVIRVGDEGRFTAHLPDQDIDFVQSFGATDKARGGAAVIVKLGGTPASGSGWYETVAPDLIDIDRGN